MLNHIQYYEIDPVLSGYIKDIDEITCKTHFIDSIYLTAWDDITLFYRVFQATWTHDGVKCNVYIKVSHDHDAAYDIDKHFIIEALAKDIASNYNYPQAVIDYFVQYMLYVSSTLKTVKTLAPKEDASISREAYRLPGMENMVSPPPVCVCRDWTGKKSRIFDLVQHLNDKHVWSREKIADWLDKLMDVDGIDLTFKVEV